jgi:hypothetical protein
MQGLIDILTALREQRPLGRGQGWSGEVFIDLSQLAFQIR